MNEAKAIDEEPEITFRLRNVDRQPFLFKLPTSACWFYPDFLAQLCDSRILVVEYKGETLVSNDDAQERSNIGEIWAKLAKGKALFIPLRFNTRPLGAVKTGGTGDFPAYERFQREIFNTLRLCGGDSLCLPQSGKAARASPNKYEKKSKDK
ncbi:MAG: hypothetical protein LBG43_08265 [Treponema sp.]|nr:hypothetical protein [Treponema sp.]